MTKVKIYSLFYLFYKHIQGQENVTSHGIWSTFVFRLLSSIIDIFSALK